MEQPHRKHIGEDLDSRFLSREIGLTYAGCQRGQVVSNTTYGLSIEKLGSERGCKLIYSTCRGKA